MTPPDPNFGGAPPAAPRSSPTSSRRPRCTTTARKPRRCTCAGASWSRRSAAARASTCFDKDEIRIGSMEDNDLVLSDDTVSRYHCKIVQEDTGYVLVDHGSTNGTFINKVRVREAFLKPGCTIGARQQPSCKFHAARRRRSRSSRRASDRCGDLIGGNVEDARDLLDHREDRADRDDGRDRGRDRHRQGGRRADDPRRCRRARAAPLVVFDCGAVPAEPDRERAVRPREGLASPARS